MAAHAGERSNFRSCVFRESILTVSHLGSGQLPPLPYGRGSELLTASGFARGGPPPVVAAQAAAGLRKSPILRRDHRGRGWGDRFVDVAHGVPLAYLRGKSRKKGPRHR